MIFQLPIADFTINFMLGLAIMFGLSLFMTYLTSKDTETFFIFLTIFAGFVVWGELVDLWVLILCLIILTMIIISKSKKNRGV